MSIPNMSIDTRILGRPEKFSGKDEDWKDWKFDLMNYLGAINSTYHDVLEAVTV